ncbi:unnamed protein product [Trichobilharzia regenti]|nr:unnamed protein product [Trichobilharzia regenti]
MVSSLTPYYITDKSEAECGSNSPSLFSSPSSKSNPNLRLSDQLSPNSSIGKPMRSASHRFAARKQALNLIPAKAAQSVAICMASAHLDPESVAQAIMELKTTISSSRNKPLSEGSSKGIVQNRTQISTSTISRQLFPEHLLDTLINSMPQMDVIMNLSDCPVDVSVRIKYFNEERYILRIS